MIAEKVNSEKFSFKSYGFSKTSTQDFSYNVDINCMNKLQVLFVKSFSVDSISFNRTHFLLTA